MSDNEKILIKECGNVISKQEIKRLEKKEKNRDIIVVIQGNYYAIKNSELVSLKIETDNLFCLGDSLRKYYKDLRIKLLE